jgi:uncharacterized protein YxjI
MSMSARCPRCGLTQLAREVCKSCGAPLPGAAPGPGSAVAVPRPAVRVASAPHRTDAVDDAFARDRFLLRQRHFAINAKYEVWNEQGQPILFVERPAHLARNLGALLAALAAAGVLGALFFVAIRLLFGDNPQQTGLLVLCVVLAIVACAAVLVVVGTMLSAKRHVTFYRDASRGERLLEILQEEKFAILVQHFTVRDPEGRPLARFTKNFLWDVLQKRWECTEPDGAPLCLAKEEFWHALLSRTLGKLFPMNFNFYTANGGLVGTFNRKFTLLDRYVLDLTGDPGRTLDRRIALALGVMLDTGERR